MYLVNGNKKFGTLEFFQVMTFTILIVYKLQFTKLIIFMNFDLILFIFSLFFILNYLLQIEI